jgi:hypothetical protein
MSMHEPQFRLVLDYQARTAPVADATWASLGLVGRHKIAQLSLSLLLFDSIPPGTPPQSLGRPRLPSVR